MDQPCHSADQVPDNGADTMAACPGWQQVVLDHVQQQLGELTTEAVGLAGMKGPTRRVMQDQIDQRSFEGILLTPLLSVPADQLLQWQIVTRETRMTV